MYMITLKFQSSVYVRASPRSSMGSGSYMDHEYRMGSEWGMVPAWVKVPVSFLNNG